MNSRSLSLCCACAAVLFLSFALSLAGTAEAAPLTEQTLRGTSWKRLNSEGQPFTLTFKRNFCFVSMPNEDGGAPPPIPGTWTLEGAGYRLVIDLPDLPTEKELMKRNVTLEGDTLTIGEQKWTRQPTPAPTGVTLPDRNAKTWTNSIGMEFVRIPAGSYLRGTALTCNPDFDASCAEKLQGKRGEMPQRNIAISEFWLSKYPVTQEQWVAINGPGSNPSSWKGRTLPVTDMSWLQAIEFTAVLNQREGHTGYRLPTEAEWEYAARAGNPAESFCDPNAPLQVVEPKPNAWGLYNMLNMDLRMNEGVKHSEFVWDRSDENYYAKSPAENPTGPKNGVRGRSARGLDPCRPAQRHSWPSDSGAYEIGFRVALVLE